MELTSAISLLLILFLSYELICSQPCECGDHCGRCGYCEEECECRG